MVLIAIMKTTTIMIRRPLVGHQAVKQCFATCKLTANSPCNLLAHSPKLPVSLVRLQFHIIEAPCLPQAGCKMLSATPGDWLLSPPWACSLRLETRSWQPWQQLLLLACKAQKTRKLLPRPPKNNKSRSRNSVKNISIKNYVLQYFR